MEYNVDYFIGKFSAIPEEKWTKGSFERDGKYCANGHCGCNEKNYMDNHEALLLADLFSKIKVTPVTKYSTNILNFTANINDNMTIEYKQPTPKQRILAALQDVKKLQEAEKTPKERIVYVTVDEPVRKLKRN